MKTKYIITIQVLASLLCISSAAVYADVYNMAGADADSEVSVWDGTTPQEKPDTFVVDGGTVTIGSAAALAWLSKVVNDGTSYDGYAVSLIVDIDLNNKEWTPIGSEAKPFKGTFTGQIDDKNSHTIKNLKIDKTESDWVGLFGYSSNKISDLNLDNAKVSGNKSVGALAGVAKNGVNNVMLTGQVEIYGTHYVGGICGGQYSVGVFSNLTVNVSPDSYVKGNSYNLHDPDLPHGEATYVGGIIGHYTEVNDLTTPYFHDISSNINVIGDVRGVGGIVGYVGNGNYLKDCSCSGNVTLIDTPYKNFAQVIGGIAGGTGESTALKLTDCKFTGELKSSYKEEGGSSTEFTDFNNDMMVGGQRKGETANIAVIIDNKVFYEGAELSGNDKSGNIQYISEGSDVYLYKDCKVKTNVSLPNVNYHILPGASLTVSENATLTFTGAMSIGDGATLAVEEGSSLTNSGLVINFGTISGWTEPENVLNISVSPSSSGSVTIDSVSGSAVTATAEAESGYGFKNWTDGTATDANATKAFAVTGVLSWTAVFEPVVTVTFHANDGTGTTTTQTIAVGTETALDPNTFAREGYIFEKWNTKADGTGTPYEDGEKVNIEEDLTLYAQWTTDITALIAAAEVKDGVVEIELGENTYQFSSGTIQKAGMETLRISGAGDDKTIITKGSKVFNASGLDLVFENVKIIGSDTDGYWGFQHSSSEKYLDCAFTNYIKTYGDAYFERCTFFQHSIVESKVKYAVHIYSSYGEFVDCTFDTIGKQILVYQENLQQETKIIGCTFNATEICSGKAAIELHDELQPIVATIKDCVVTGFDKGDKSDVPLYNWTSGASLTLTATDTVSFIDGETKTDVTVTYNTAVGKPEDPVKEGYAFQGWYTESEEEYDFEEVVREPISLYAKWEECTLTITFKANGGMGSMDQQTIKGSDESKTLTPNGFTREGYAFAGWKVTGGTDVYEDEADVSDLLTKVGGTLSLDAQWATYDVTVTFNANGGTGTMAAQTFKSQTATALKDNGFTREGYTFAYWSTTASGTGTTYADKATVTLTGNLALYAIWSQTPVAVYAVTFDSKGGSDVQPISVISGNVAEKPANPTKENSKFAGWYSDEGYSTRYTFTEPVTRNITLYAAWIGVVNVSVPTGDGYTSTPAGVASVTIGTNFTFTIGAKDGYTVTAVYAGEQQIGTATGTFTITPEADTPITVVFSKDGKTTETTESTVDNDDGTVTTNETKTETDGTSGNATISEKSTTKDGETVKSTVETTADVTSSAVSIEVKGDSDNVSVSGSIAEAIDAAGSVENKNVAVTTPKKTVTIEKDAWDILGETDVTVTVNNGAEFKTAITVSKETFGTQSSLALGVAESSKVIPSEIGTTTKAFDLTATMGGNAVSTFEKKVKVVMTFDSIPSNASKVYAYCIDNEEKIEATFNSQTGEVSFETPHFSSWTIVYEEPSSSSGSNTLAIVIAVVLVGCLALAAVAVLFRRKNAA